MLDFRRITLFYLEKRLSKHKMTIFSKNLGGMAPFAPPSYAYATVLVPLPITANFVPGFLSASFLKQVANWSASVVGRCHQSMLMSRRWRNL